MSLSLANIRVPDLSRALCGRFCSMILGDPGADLAAPTQPLWASVCRVLREGIVASAAGKSSPCAH